MKIVAYSKVPATTPYVHLGYLAATTTSLVWGLFWGGAVILVVSIAGRRLRRLRKYPESEVASKPHGHKWRAVELTLFLLGCIGIVAAFAFGKKVYVAPDRLTVMRVVICRQYLDSSKSGSDPNIVATLPTQEGQYDLHSVLSVGGWSVKEYSDAWNTPLVLRAIRHEDQLRYVVVSAGPDRVVGTQDDITAEGQQPRLLRQRSENSP